MKPRYHGGDTEIFSVEAVEQEGIVDGRNYFVQFEDGENTFIRVLQDPESPELLILRCWNDRYADRKVSRRRIRLMARAVYRLVPDSPTD